LSLAKECYSKKVDLLTDATVGDDAIRFISSNQLRMTSASSSNEDDKEESKDHLDEEHEDGTREITTNHIF
jgi:hypothetical protein